MSSRVVVLAVALTGYAASISQAPVLATTTAATPTFSKDVAPILYRNCASCHRPGESAPMSLLTFSDARPWAKAIRLKVVNREMPPWGADRAHGEFANDPSLSEQEIRTIAEWVDAGAPEGAAQDLPVAPVFPASWKIGTPDVVIGMPSTYAIPAGGPRILQDFPIATTFDEDKYIEIAEVIPGRRSHTHHAIVSVNDGSGSSRIASYLPGGPTSSLPRGVVKMIPKGAAINLNMHYNPNGVAASDGDTKIGFRFARGPVEKVAITAMSGTRALDIPPGDSNYEAKGNPFVFKEDSHIISLLPRMNERGKDYRYTLVYPDGTSRILLNVSRFDDAWQPAYLLKTPIAAPKGSRIETLAHYDNSAANKRNPDPTRRVPYGPEIMNGYFDYTVDGQAIRLSGHQAIR